MRTLFKIALRYVFSFRSFHFITFISILSGIGISIGVAALIIVTSLFNGFREFAQVEIIGLDPHLRILPNRTELISVSSAELDSLAQVYGFQYFPFIESKIILSGSEGFRVAVLFGIEDTKFAEHPIRNKVIPGSNLSHPSNTSEIGALIGITLADLNLKFHRNALEFITLEDFEKSAIAFSLPTKHTVPIAGIFQTNNTEYDNNFIFVNYSMASSILHTKPTYFSGIDIRLQNIGKIEDLKGVLQKTFQNERILTWYDLNESILNAMQFERIAVFIILSLIIAIAVFNVFASLVMTVLEKKPDVASLMAIGATKKQIRSIFILQGAIIGTISTFVGLLLGLGLTIGQMKFEWVKLNTQKYIISALPMKIEPLTVLAIIVVALFLSFVATIYPARKASEVNVAETIFRE
jgi:lipoprotein-releasing system permease protein